MYQGAGPAGCFLALHKAAARQAFRDAGLVVPPGRLVPRHPGAGRPDLAYPVFGRADAGGSSLRPRR
ncbi:MAG: hypothetical protein V8Q84_03300 [Bilophila sp.]